MRFTGTMEVKFEIDVDPFSHGKTRADITTDYVAGVVAERTGTEIADMWSGIDLEVVSVREIRREG